MADRSAPILLYGATGYTGRLIAHELDQFGASFVIAGRDQARLDALREELPSKPHALAIDVHDAAALREAVEGASAVVSAAGPFIDLGPPIVEACLAARTPFTDITGEQGYLRWCHEQDARARAADVAIVNGLGFDVVPSDLAAVLACGGRDDVASLDLCIHFAHTAISRGTRASMSRSVGTRWWYDRGSYRYGPPGRFIREFDVPGLGTRTAIFVPWGDVATAHRSTSARTVRTFFTMNPKQAKPMHRLWPLVGLWSATPWFRRKLERRVSDAKAGPGAERRAKQTFTVVAEATLANGSVRRAFVEGRDPYGLTGRAAAIAGMRLARGGVKRSGVLTPSQAWDLESFCKQLEEQEVSWRVEA